jgi:hypothetical protein
MAPIWPNWRHRGGTESGSRFQAESYLSQKGMLDYDMSTERNSQPGPLGLDSDVALYG